MASETTQTEVGYADSGGMPQISQTDSFPSQIFWLFVTLIALYFVFSRIALPRIGQTIEERQDTIAGDLDKAEEFNRKAEEAEAEYLKALQDARSEAQRIAEETKASIRSELATAQAEIDQVIEAKAKESAAHLEKIQAEAGSKATVIAEETARELVAAFTSAKPDSALVSSVVSERLSGRFGG